MSVVALQEGNVNLPYDGPFIFSEVNADKVHWVRQPNGKFQKAALDKRRYVVHNQIEHPGQSI